MGITYSYKSGRKRTINRKNVQSILTLDSCLWAHVEEALISLQECRAAGSTMVERQEAVKKLDDFEDYVYESLKDYSVSLEIFLQESSYVRWWNGYIRFKGASHGSRLANFMKNYGKYGNSEYDFSCE